MVGSILLIQIYVYSIVKGYIVFVGKYVTGTKCFSDPTLGASSRILAAFFFPGKSHFMMTNAIIRELVRQGHEVKFITPFSLAKEKLGPNYKEIVIPQYDFWPESK